MGESKYIGVMRLRIRRRRRKFTKRNYLGALRRITATFAERLEIGLRKGLGVQSGER